jgi:hypothetical protein
VDDPVPGRASGVRLHHKTPCNERPWRLAAAAGWLGGYTPEFYTDAVQANEVPACHLRDQGPDNDDTAMCIGALSVMANGCVSAWRTEGGEEARQVIGRREDTFPHPVKFFEHHTGGKPWVSPLLRRMGDWS